MNKIQQRTLELMENVEPKENLKPWIRGRIPKHYKRLTIPMSEAIELAKQGAQLAMAYFNERPFFTQALIIGATLNSRYKNIVVVTTSQYGKTFTCGAIAILLANNGETVRIVGVTDEKTAEIMNSTNAHLQIVDESIKDKLIGGTTKIESLMTSLSKTKIGFLDGGSIERVTLGDTRSGLASNNAIGKGGCIIADEIDLATEDGYAEMGRREFSGLDGEKKIMLEISNPHNNSTFYKKLTSDNVPSDRLIIWMDIRTALEEQRHPGKEWVQNTDFFNNQSTCQRYLLCELDEYANECMFGKLEIDDSPIDQDAQFFIGCDSAYKGKDNIELFLSSVDKKGKIRLLDYIVINKGEWVDGLTSLHIMADIMMVINQTKASMICVDVGQGIWLVEGLTQRMNNFRVRGINSASKPTPERSQKNHYSARYGANKRAEMHLDLQQLIETNMVTATTKAYEAIQPQMRHLKLLYKTNDRIGITPKDEIKVKLGRSPDTLDACLLSIHAIMLHSIFAPMALYQDERGVL